MKLFIGIICVFMFATTTFAADSATNDFIQLLNQTNSMKASFTQTQLDNHGKATQKSYGQMALQRPGKFRWDITKPQPQLIVAKENKLWIYDPDLEQLTIRSLQNASGDTPALLLSHDNANLEKNYIIKTLPKNDNALRWFSLTAKEKDSMFKNMELGFSNNQIQEMHLQDNLGHETIVKFQKIQLNVNLPSSLFTIKPSKNVDVIDETKKTG